MVVIAQAHESYDLETTFPLSGQYDGLSQYGDMFRTAMGLVQDIFKIDNSTGLSGFNEAVVEPLTDSKNNKLGEIYYSDLFQQETRIKVGAFDTNNV